MLQRPLSRIRRSSALGLLAWAISFGLPAAAFAQAAPPPAEDVSDEADRLFRQANDAFKADKWQQAVALYEAAFAKKRTHDIAANLAYAELKLGRRIEAARHLAFAVKNAPPTGKAENRRIAVERLKGLKAELVTLSVEVNVGGAEIVVNGKPVGTSPLNEEVFALPGAVKVEAKHAGYTPAQQEVQAAKGAEQSVKLTLVAEAEEYRGPAVSSMTSGSPLAGSSTLPAAQSGIAPISNSNGAGAKGDIVDERARWSKAELGIVIAGGAVSAILLGTGVGFTVRANQTASETDMARDSIQKAYGGDACRTAAPGCEDMGTFADKQSAAANAAFGTFIAGGVVGAGTLAYALITWKKHKSAAMQVVPVVAAGGTGVSVRGQW